MNKKKQRNMLFTMLLLVMALLIPQWGWAQTTSQPSVGDGSKDYPFEIATCEELAWFRDWVNGTYTPAEGETTVAHLFAYAKLTDNIDLKNEAWTPIGGTDGRTSYAGVFDGNGKTISNLNIEGGDYAAFFAASKAATIMNLKISNAHVKGSDGTGVLVGIASNTTMSGVRITDSKVAGDKFVGGIAGCLINSNFVNCQTNATVEGNSYVGGVAGANRGKSIFNNVFTSGSVSYSVMYGGLLLGGIMDNSSVRAAKLVAYDSEAKLIYNGTELQDVSVIGRGSLAAGFILGCNKATLKSGVVAYMLQAKNLSDDVAWGQNLSENGGDAYPVLGSAYRVYTDTDVRLSCNGEMSYNGTFTNEETDEGWLSLIHNGTANYVDGTSATCKENGKRPHYTCSYCHGTFEDQALTLEIPDITEYASHKYDDGIYSWDESAGHEMPSANVTYTCLVCETQKTSAMTVGFDYANKDVSVTCTMAGTKFYKATYRDLESDTYFSDTHTQTLPALGHDIATEVTFNAEKEIYVKGCTRNCGYNEYFATSDGSVAAAPNADATVFTVNEFTLNDATTYTSKAQFTVTNLTYSRTFSHDKWQAVYVPFDVECGQISNDYEVATINNFHEYEQADGSTNLELEVKRVTTSSTIPALTPCLIRKKQVSDGDLATAETFHFIDASFKSAAEKSIDCASVTRYYQFFGILEGKSDFDEYSDFCMGQGALYSAQDGKTLSPQRWYLKATDRTGGSLSSIAQLRSIAIRVIGDGDATGIEDIHVTTDYGTANGSKQGIYDLQGRKLDKEPASGIYIKDGQKYVK